jgi:hypothetical protein
MSRSSQKVRLLSSGGMSDVAQRPRRFQGGLSPMRLTVFDSSVLVPPCRERFRETPSSHINYLLVYRYALAEDGFLGSFFHKPSQCSIILPQVITLLIFPIAARWIAKFRPGITLKHNWYVENGKLLNIKVREE